MGKKEIVDEVKRDPFYISLTHKQQVMGIHYLKLLLDGNGNLARPAGLRDDTMGFIKNQYDKLTRQSAR